MKITCPECGNKFNWDPPKDTVIYKMLTSEDLEKRKPERYVVTCPKCKTKLSICY